MTAMTIGYPDVSSAQAGMSLARATVVCAKITQGTGYANPFYGQAKEQAAAEGALFFAYHFLTGGNPAGQAAWCRRNNSSNVPLMVDCEPVPAQASWPSLADLLGFIDSYRQLGGIC